MADPGFIEFACAEPAALDLEWNYTDRSERIYLSGHRCLARGFFAEALTLFQRATHYDAAHYAAYVCNPRRWSCWVGLRTPRALPRRR